MRNICRHEFYQKPQEVVVTIFAKGIPSDSVAIDFGEQIVGLLLFFFWHICFLNVQTTYSVNTGNNLSSLYSSVLPLMCLEKSRIFFNLVYMER